jgi:hypothetical protein
MSADHSSHRVSFDRIRRLAIECHALDLAVGTLFESGTYSPSAATRDAQEELISENLLALAVSIRTKFYQGTPWTNTEQYLLERYIDDTVGRDVGERKPLTIKDVCDKIIHAEAIERDIFESEWGYTTSLTGSKNGTAWTLILSMSLFAEAVLTWLDELSL